MPNLLFDNLAGASGVYFDALTSAPAIDPVVTAVADGDVYPGETGVVITGTKFGAAQGAGTVTIGGVEQTVTAWGDTSITITVVLGTAGYGANDLVVTDDGAAASDAYLVTLSPPTGYEYVELTSVHATASERLTSSPDLAVGDQIEWSNVVGTGAVTVYDDGTFSADEGVLSFDFRVWDSASPSWGASATQLVEPSVVPDIVNSTEAAALAAIASASMVAGTVDSSYDAVVPDGSVKAQGTAADEVVLRGASLDYTLSDGPTPVTVPDVVGLTVAAATTAIEGAGLVVGSQASSYSSSVASGLVISQTQTAGSELPGGSAVDILVSLGAWAGSIQRSPWMFGFSFLFGGGGGGSAPAWTPASLFASGEEGVWYDPSDLTTGNMYQDSAKTTAVTAVEQPVGWIQDKSGNGNHASQSTAASRPVLRARYNLLTYSEAFDNAAWVEIDATMTSTAESSPDSGSTAGLLTAGTAVDAYAPNTTTWPGISSSVVPVATPVTLSAYVKAGTASSARLGLFRTGLTRNFLVDIDLITGDVTSSSSTYTVLSASSTNVGGGWWRVSVTGTVNVVGNVFVLGHAPSASSGETIYIWGAQLNYGDTAFPYQRIAAATDYVTSSTMAGYDFPYYLDFDGVDDSLATAAIDFSATDEMSVFAGVTKDTTQQGVICGLGLLSNNGTFSCTAADFGAAGNDYGAYLRGTVIAGYQLSTYTPPVTNVMAVNFDISGELIADEIFPRIDGATPTLTTLLAGPAGTGNFSSTQQLSIGSRTDGNIFLDGRIYSIIVRGVTSTAEEIAAAESYVASKSGVTLA